MEDHLILSLNRSTEFPRGILLAAGTIYHFFFPITVTPITIIGNYSAHAFLLQAGNTRKDTKDEFCLFFI